MTPLDLLNAVTSGIKIGSFGASIVARYDKSVYLNKGADLDALINRLNQHLVNLESLKSQIPSFWDDETGNKTVLLLNENIKKVTNATDIAKKLRAYCDEYIENLDATQKRADSIIAEEKEKMAQIIPGLDD